MEGEEFFLDSYAIFAMVEGKESYKRFYGITKIVTTKLNLMEVYYTCLMRKNEDYAEFAFNRFKEFCVEISDEDLKDSMKFKTGIKRAMPKSNISYVDAVGYAVSKKHGVKFLTGDSEFEGLDNVEFVR